MNAPPPTGSDQPSNPGAEAALLRAVIDHLPGLVFWKDTHSVYLGGNAAFAAAVGLPNPAAVVGKTDAEWPGRADAAAAEVADDRAVMTSGLPKLGIVESRRRADGRMAWVETNKIPLRDTAGRVIGILGTSLDITARKEAKQELRRYHESLEMGVQERIHELRESDALLARIFDTSPVAIGIVGEDRVIKFVNHEFNRFFGAKVGDSAPQLYAHPQDREEMITRLRRDGSVRNWQVQMLDCRHGVRDVLANFFLIRYRNENATLGWVFDITDRIEMERSLETARLAAEAANRAKSAFLANMSHEIRTPMNAILGYAQIMERDERMPAHVVEQVRTIKRAGDHLLLIINDILEMSKIESGRISLTPADFDLHTLLGELHSLCTERARNKGLTLTLTTAPDTPRHLKADAVKLRQVLLNLIGNAIKFTHTGGVTIAADGELLSDGRAALRFTITDTGPGIAAEELPKLFKPFSQTLSGATTAGGTGLGLAIGREYARLMDGDIGVASTPGIGSAFTLTIRVPTGDPATFTPARKHPVARHIAADLRPPRLLVAEDNALNSDLLKAQLLPLGFDLTLVANGAAAVAAAADTPYDAILMDMQMPVMDGKTAIRTLRAGGVNAKTPVIALTASAFEEEKGDFLAAGADIFIRKPFDLDDLLDKLGDLLHLRYEYASEKTGAPPKGRGAEDFAALRGPTRAAITEAAQAADYDRLCNLIASLDPQTGAELRKLADAYDYEAICALLPAAARPA